MINQIAMLTYGALTLTLATLLAWSVGSFWGMLTAVMAAGLTYVFQVITDEQPYLTTLMKVVWAAVIVLTVMSLVLSTLAGGFA